MSATRVVCVSQRVDISIGREERRDALDQRLCEWLCRAGCLPVPVPNRLPGASAANEYGLRAWLEAVGPEALVLSGGNDIGEAPERDATEQSMLSWAAERRMPLLGICRGMQMMGVRAGGKLERLAGHVRTRHALTGSLAGNVNSFHDFALADCPSGYRVIARSEDGAIEAIRHESLPWEGWMWHPEREACFSSSCLDRARALFGA